MLNKRNKRQIASLAIVLVIYFISKSVFLVTVQSNRDANYVDFQTDADGAGQQLKQERNATEFERTESYRTDFRWAVVLGNKTNERKPDRAYVVRFPTVAMPSATASSCSGNDQDLSLTTYAADLCRNSSRESCSMLTCQSLLTGNGSEANIALAKQLMSDRPAPKETDASFIEATRNCDVFKKTRGYHLNPTGNKEVDDFPIAFNLIVHKGAEQVEGLLRALYRPQNLYCIHVDAKAPGLLLSAIRSIAGCFDNVRMASRLEVLTWGGYNRLQADINCMRDLINSTVQWKYLINTAGQAYPLKTVEEMVQVLRIYNGANDIEGIYGARVIKSRFEQEWHEDSSAGSVKTTGRKNPKPPHDIDIVRGSAYGIFSRQFVRFMMEDQRAIDLLNWSRKTWSPDELYWATLHHTYSNPHLHTPGAFSGYPSEKPWLAVYANWYSKNCRGKMVRGVCIFGVGDLPELTRRREFFANKFYADHEPLALQCLAAWIRHKEVCPPPFDSDYYKSLPFIIRNSPPQRRRV